MTRVYLAGPLFNAAERDFNEKITSVLEKAGYSVFLPQRDGILAAELDKLDDAEKVKTVFKKDTSELKRADVVLMLLDGRVPDEGACAELGMAYAMGKRCYGMKTDARALENGLEINPLIAGCFEKIICNLNGDEALLELENFLSENNL